MHNLLSKLENRQNPLAFINVIICYLYRLIGISDGEVPLLRSFGSYQLLTEISSFGSKRFFSLGIYVKNNKKYFIKHWSGKTKSLFYYSLKNEINNYEQISRFLSQNIRFPKVVEIEESNENLTLVLEYLEGTSLGPYDSSNQSRFYFRIIEFLSNLYKTNKNQFKFLTRSNYTYCLLFPVIFVKACLNNPEKIDLLIKCLPTYLKSFIPFILCNSYTIVHKDLNFRNILINSDWLYLIDLQYLCVTHPFMEYAASLRSEINNSDFVNDITRHVYSTNSRTDLIIFNFLVVYYAVLGLTDKSFSENRKLDFVKLLNYIMEVSKI